jgi:ABC transport system ATP-binding/permease protein
VIVPEGNGNWIEYAGGYSDMLVQRGADLTRATPSRDPLTAAKEPTSVIAEPPPAKRRFMFKEKRALETLPKTIDKLQSKIKELQAKLADPQFYARDRAAFEMAAAALTALHLEIAAAEEQWLELEIIREELSR